MGLVAIEKFFNHIVTENPRLLGTDTARFRYGDGLGTLHGLRGNNYVVSFAHETGYLQLQPSDEVEVIGKEESIEPASHSEALEEIIEAQKVEINRLKNLSDPEQLDLLTPKPRTDLKKWVEPPPKEDGKKFDDGKTRFDLFPLNALEEINKALMFGAEKYGDHNWKKVEGKRVRYFNAAMRHLISWFKGEKLDPESRYNHLAHAACCLLILLEEDVEQ